MIFTCSFTVTLIFEL